MIEGLDTIGLEVVELNFPLVGGWIVQTDLLRMGNRVNAFDKG